MMTLREKQLLTLMAADLKTGRNWVDRGISGFVGVKITWDELHWLKEFEKAATLTRIEAAFIVDRAALSS